VLEDGQGFNETGAALVDEEGGFDASRRITETPENGGPAIETVGVGGAEVDTQIVVLTGDGEAIGLAGEDVGAGDKTAQGDGVFGLGVEHDAMALEHGHDGRGVAFGHPEARRVFIHDEKIAVAVKAAEQGDGVMVEAVIEGGDPFDNDTVIKIVNDVDVAAEGGEELAGGDVPITIAPGALLPAGEVVEGETVIGVGEGVVIDRGGDEAGEAFTVLLKGNDVAGAVPGVADAAGIGGGVNAGTPARLGGAAAGDNVLILAGGERGGLLDADDVIFEAEIGINVLLALEMAGDDAGAVGEGEGGARGGEFVGQKREKAATDATSSNASGSSRWPCM